MNVNIKSDKELVSLLIRGEESAFCDLYVRYKDRLFLFCYSLLKSEEEANDVVQEIFVNIWESRCFINPDLSFSSFLYTIAKNRILNYFRHAEIKENVITSLASQSQTYEDRIESDIVYEEYQEILLSAINKLPPQRKRIFNLSRIEHYTHKEIAEKLGISVYTVQEHISESLQFIKRYLAKHAGIEVGVWILFLFK